MRASSQMWACSLQRHWSSMTALRPLVGQPGSGPERSCSALHLISKQVRSHTLGALRNCQPSSDNNGEAVSRSGIDPSILRLPWRNMTGVNDCAT